MTMTQWVQHISGQGEKWELVNSHFATSKLEWQVYMKSMTDSYHWLPKSEYRLCDPPEVWKDVTGACRYEEDGILLGPENSSRSHPIIGSIRQVETLPRYRLRKVRAIIEPNQHTTTWAFLIDQKVQP